MKQNRTVLSVMVLILSMSWWLLFTGCDGIDATEGVEPDIQESQLLTEPQENLTEGLQDMKPVVPILLYHHITEDAQANAVSVDRFEEQIRTLSDAGYTSVSFQQLIDFVENGTTLPEKSVVITFDDGYVSNLSLAAPILQKYGMNATVFVIGISIGKDTYKDTGVAMIPHFSLADTGTWGDVIWIESHGYDVHEVAGRDPEPIRLGVLQKENETEEAFAEFLASDCTIMADLFLDSYGRPPQVFAYPYGMFSDLSDNILMEHGIRVTVTTRPFVNLLEQGNWSCLLRMGRFSINEDVSAEALKYLLEYGSFPEATEPENQETDDTEPSDGVS